MASHFRALRPVQSEVPRELQRPGEPAHSRGRHDGPGLHRPLLSFQRLLRADAEDKPVHFRGRVRGAGLSFARAVSQGRGGAPQPGHPGGRFGAHARAIRIPGPEPARRLQGGGMAAWLYAERPGGPAGAHQRDRRLLPLGIAIFNFSDFYELMFERVPLEELEEGWFIEHVVARKPFYDRMKRVLDILLSFAILVLIMPLAVVIGALITLTSRGPAVFRQKRMGRNDREFMLYKFRTMTTWQGGNDGTPAWTVANDSRITGFGRLLRATHLDEIPQLWNILRGDISFTGPRPERVELAKEFAAFPYYEIRHVVQPGLTGWAQINYRPSASLEEARTKLAYDVYYVKNRSFLLDVAIILKTIKYIFRAGGG